MAKYNVELFGMSNEVVGLRNVDVELDDGASLADLVAALRREMPALEGSVISPGEDRLTKHYTFNINGRFYIDDYTVNVRPDDHIVLLTFALGG
jgi:molybdopterin converting factor small subunit